MDRWNELFDQLEASATVEQAAELRETADQISRAEFARITVVDRLRSNLGQKIQVRTSGLCDLVGKVSRVEPEWLLLSIKGSRVVVPIANVAALMGLNSRAFVPEAGQRGADSTAEIRQASVGRDGGAREGVRTPETLDAKARALAALHEMTLTKVLRAISRDREPVIVQGHGVEARGMISRVGFDHFDVLDLSLMDWNQRAQETPSRGEGILGSGEFSRDARSRERQITTFLTDNVDYVRIH